MIINGGRPLYGTVTPVANKNTIIKLIPAALLTDQTVTIHNVPMSSDVRIMCQICEKLGGTVEFFNNDSSLRINCAGINSYSIDAELSDKLKASILFVAPLLLRFGKAEMPTPQWCKLWTRPLDVIVENMIEMGADYRHEHGTYYFDAPGGIQPKHIRQRFPSVTGTEALVILAVKAPGETVIQNCACEPHVQELCEFLVQMWADIQGIGSNKLTITGVKELWWTEWTVRSDHLDVAGFIAAAVMTDGELTINNAVVEQMWLIIKTYEKLWVHVQVDRDRDQIFVPLQTHLECKRTVKGDLEEIKALHWPLLPPDIIHTIAVVALKAQGNMMFRNIFYEYSFFFIQELAKMKAMVVMADPTKIITFWPTAFKPAKMVCSDIIQATYALVLAGLAAPWRSELLECDSLFRRFPNIAQQFNSLGWDVIIQP